MQYLLEQSFDIFTSVLLAELPGIGIAGSKCECTCGFATSCLIPFHEGCAILHSPCSGYECFLPAFSAKHTVRLWDLGQPHSSSEASQVAQW